MYGPSHTFVFRRVLPVPSVFLPSTFLPRLFLDLFFVCVMKFLRVSEVSLGWWELGRRNGAIAMYECRGIRERE